MPSARAIWVAVIDVDRGDEMTLFLTMATLAVPVLLMPDVLAQIPQAAGDYLGFGVGGTTRGVTLLPLGSQHTIQDGS